jgi:GT2 family glycosyltransferase/glycosyltransferase involved in cell wall biosynthesis
VSILRQLKQLYYRLPLTPAMRHRLGLFKRRLVGAPGTAPGIFQSGVPGVAPGIAQDAALGNPQSIKSDFSIGPFAEVPADIGPAPRVSSDSQVKLATDLIPETVAVFYGVIDWHFRHQRPQQLALSLARRGMAVFYISVNFVDDASPGFRIEELDPTLKIYQIFLHVKGSHSVYQDTPSKEIWIQQKIGQRMLWEYFRIRDAIHIVQHPYWTNLAASAAASKLVYDCMDFHAGFANTSQAHHEGELALIRLADLTVVSSDYLYDMAKKAGAKALALIRNATEYHHFNRAFTPTRKAGKRVIGYYGAIAEWFDIDLVRAVALAFPDAELRLIGADTVNAQQQLARVRNIQFLGEWPYEKLPEQLASFDVCLIPFKLIELTLATNPVKVYEYLSAGKPVVAVDLPELKGMDELIYRCTDTPSYVDGVREALAEDSVAMQRARMAFAEQQTWEHRASALVNALADGRHEPLVSVVIVTYNNQALTERCLASLADPEKHGEYGLPLEVIVIDNSSGDGSAQMLSQWVSQASLPGSPLRHRRLLLNAENRGFGPAVNQGLALAKGEYLVILNNDTIVTAGWARGLIRHLQRNAELGMVGPVTNNIGNESMIPLPRGSVDLTCFMARRYNLDHGMEAYPLRIAAFFCVMLPREVYESIGGLDEQFVPGFFEDDDYCLRLGQAGYRIACAEDVFVYHELSASFDQLALAKRAAIFERNKALFEAKWGPWIPHQYRPNLPRLN